MHTKCHRSLLLLVVGLKGHAHNIVLKFYVKCIVKLLKKIVAVVKNCHFNHTFFIVLYSDSGCYDLNYGKSSRSIGVQTNADWKRQLLSESAVKQKVSIQRCNKT